MSRRAFAAAAVVFIGVVRDLPRAICVLGVMTLLLAACSDVGNGPTPGTGDPGNKRLNQLSTDPIFASLPPGAQQVGSMEKIAAKYRRPAFEPAGWDGPAVKVTFSDAQPPESVFSFYTSNAVAAGWMPATNRNVLGFPETWNKTFPGKWLANLGLIDMSLRTAKPGEAHTYVLNAAAPAIDANGH